MLCNSYFKAINKDVGGSHGAPSLKQPPSVADERDWSNLPSEVLYQLALNMDWRDLLALELVSKSMKTLLSQEPLIWAAQILRTFSKDKIPQVVLHWMSSPLSPTQNWRTIFSGMLRRCPACAFAPESMEAMDNPDHAHSPTSLVTLPGSDYDQVLCIQKRATFTVAFDSLPPGRYVVMGRIKVAPGREAYISFTSKFRRHRLGSSSSFVSPRLSATPANVHANPFLDVPPGDNVWATQSAPIFPVAPAYHDWLSGVSVSQDAVPTHQLSNLSDATLSSNKANALSSPLGSPMGSKKWGPTPQFLLGSYSASWQQVGRPLVAFSRLQPMLTGSGRGIRAPKPDNLSENSRNAKLGLDSARDLMDGTEAKCKGNAKTIPNEHGWQMVPIGHVTVRAACRSLSLSFVTLSSSQLRMAVEPPPFVGSIFIDYISLKPACRSLMNPMNWLLSTKASGSMKSKVAKMLRRQTTSALKSTTPETGNKV